TYSVENVNHGKDLNLEWIMIRDIGSGIHLAEQEFMGGRRKFTDRMGLRKDAFV
ncbi:hypothetical protein S83_023853, partial [Arachis hypogaea]